MADPRLSPHQAAAEAAIARFIALMEQKMGDTRSQIRTSAKYGIDMMPPFIRAQAAWEDEGIPLNDRAAAFVNLFSSMLGTFIRSNGFDRDSADAFGEAVVLRAAGTVSDFITGKTSGSAIIVTEPVVAGHG